MPSSFEQISALHLKLIHYGRKKTLATHQICDSSKMGNFDLVKNSFAAEPGKQRNENTSADEQNDPVYTRIVFWAMCASVIVLPGMKPVRSGWMVLNWLI